MNAYIYIIYRNSGSIRVHLIFVGCNNNEFWKHEIITALNIYGN